MYGSSEDRIRRTPAMTINLPKDVETSIQAAVLSGRFASMDDAMAEAARLLLGTLKSQPETGRPCEVTTSRRKHGQPIATRTEEDVLRQMLADGLITQL